MTRSAFLVALLIFLASPIDAQKKPLSSLCTRDNAIDTAKQQILITRMFDNPVHRISVLLRAADLLWPYDQEKSLAAFMEAFDLAVQNFKEKGDQTERASSSRLSAVIQLPDRRFAVISALAKRDPVRARKLSERMLQDDARDVADKSATDDQSKRLTADKLLRMAFDLVPTDPSTAINFARQSFRYPATLQLPIFFYQLGIRDSLLNWFYYFRTQELIKNKNFVEARKFASKVNELDQRAYLFTRIAEESLKAGGSDRNTRDAERGGEHDQRGAEDDHRRARVTRTGPPLCESRYEPWR